MRIILRTQRQHERIERRAPPGIKWRNDDYAVLDGEARIGCIYCERVPSGVKWRWFLQTGAPLPNSGAGDTLGEAKAAIAVRYEAERRSP